MNLVLYALGNNDPKYLQTKHNIGRIVLEHIATELQLKFEKGNGYFFTKAQLNEEKATVYLIYSSGYMNESGQALGKFLNFFKLNASQTRLLILQDDSDQIEGNVKFLPGGGSAGHRGIDDIYRHLPGLNLDLKNLWRLKIGIRPPQNRLRSETFVLNKISLTDEQFSLKLSQKIIREFPHLLENNFTKFQSRLFVE